MKIIVIHAKMKKITFLTKDKMKSMEVALKRLI